jgi:OFA family oxalate/formate antiporter-like MFS transporter
MIEQSGFQHTFLFFGLIQGAVIFAAALFMRVPPPAAAAPGWPMAKTGAKSRDFSPGEVLRSPVFWVLYIMFVSIAAGGLITDAQTGPMARSAGIAKTPVIVLGLFTMAALPLATQMKGILNGISRIFFGWASDGMGRELTMFIAFAAQGVAVWLMVSYIASPGYFVLFSSLVFFTWGEIFSLFPAISGDLFGKKYATTNYALLYTAKGTASLLVPLAGYVKQSTGSWWPIFTVVIVLDVIAALLTWFVLRPMTRRWKGQAVKPELAGNAVPDPV